MRAVIAIVAGIVVGFIALILIALIGGLLFPSPAQIDNFNSEQLIAAFPTLAMGAKIAIILSWFGGAFVGAATAKRLAGRGWAAWTIAGFFCLYVLLNVLILPMPGWLQAIAVAAPLIGGLLANHFVAERVAAEPARTAPEPNAETRL